MNLSFNVLNQAMLTQVLHELRQGNLQRCKALGLGEDDIYLLQSLPPTTLSRLAHATVPWVEVKIDSPVMHRLIEQAERDEQNERLINRALKLGASSTIMYQCFGLAHSETALRRRLLKIEIRKGRPQHLSEAQEHALWQRWCQLRVQDGSEDQLDAMMMLAEEQQISLTIVWQQIDQYSNGT
ncbi:hypothetical protein CS078_13290 [Pseudomonas prosekii]|uniref:DUF2857 domain-containing protein n=1 Tax=Pseudomonas prosekii TaxID=1148509 RepID=A0A3L8CMN5_9PSED|nr:DUF2857 domain-containing protein [Pseudomonas prosekii]RLU09121.1 hypothetical protein CS078_13290 [Pseudomonas prosekii]RLU11964.1 hypothetical protein CS076_07640 [Pseudomonas prosekii]